MRRCSPLGVPAQTALALSDQWPSIQGDGVAEHEVAGSITRPVASQPPVAVASPVVTVRIAGTRRPASLAMTAWACAATSASLTPGSASSLTALWTMSDRREARRIASSSTGSLMRRARTTSSSTSISSAPSARSTSATATGSDDASMPMRPGPPARPRRAASSSTSGAGARS